MLNRFSEIIKKNVNYHRGAGSEQPPWDALTQELLFLSATFKNIVSFCNCQKLLSAFARLCYGSRSVSKARTVANIVARKHHQTPQLCPAEDSEARTCRTSINQGTVETKFLDSTLNLRHQNNQCFRSLSGEPNAHKCLRNTAFK